MPIVDWSQSGGRSPRGSARSVAQEAAPDAISSTISETSDAFLGGTLHISQPKRGYRAGLDAVLLAAAVPKPQPGRTQKLLDVGSGVGVVGLSVAARLPMIDVVLVEQSDVLCGLAERNVTANALQGRVDVIHQDVLAPQQPAHLKLSNNSFDVVVSNPPYYEAARHRRSPSALKADSHSMPADGLERWLRFMSRMTRPGGRAIIIHRADQLADLLSAMSSRFGEIVLQPLHPRAGQPASRVILSGVRGSRAPMRVSPGLILHGDDNRFTAQIDKVLKTPTELELL